jgi:glycyl-tRNA synthetase beta chain
MPNFLLEIGTEEIPARMIDGASLDLGKRVVELLVRESLLNVEQNMSTVAPEATGMRFPVCETPRRLAMVVSGVAATQPDVTEQLTGPATKVAYKDGQPTPAAHAFAKKAGVDVSQLQKVTTPKGEYLTASVTNKGKPAVQILAELLSKEIASIYWPKNMYWRAGKPERFVRPVRWIVAMLDGEVIPLEFAGIKAGNQSRGHRILGPQQVSIASSAQYAETMKGAHVTVLSADREHKIRKALDAVTRTVPGARWREDAELLKTVVNLTEWPSAILGSFDKEYLSLPEEVLVTVMRDHQKYFAVEDAAGKLAPYFLAVLNTDGDPDGLIRHGNERVLRARFNDARFFWDTDQKTLLVNRVEMLKAVTFQKDLGSYSDKTYRVEALAGNVAGLLQQSGQGANHAIVSTAAHYSKADLTTELVKEFTELQGVVGGLYVVAQGLHGYEGDPEFVQRVADAVYDQYKPESMEDSVPRTLEGAILSIADKADTVVGMFGLRLIPSGSKDPFALRRQANGIIKTLAEHSLLVSLSTLISAAADQYARHPKTDLGQLQQYKARVADILSGLNPVKDVISPGDEIAGFFIERLQFYLRDVLGLAYDVVNATLAAGADDVVDAVARANAIKEVRSSDDFAPLFIAFKRIKNIIKQAREKQFKILEAGAFYEMTPVESEIWNQMQPIGNDYLERCRRKDYAGALKELARLRTPVDLYFDKVLVMVDDPEVRANRLGVLNYLLLTFNKIADLSELVVESK